LRLQTGPGSDWVNGHRNDADAYYDAPIAIKEILPDLSLGRMFYSVRSHQGVPSWISDPNYDPKIEDEFALNDDDRYAIRIAISVALTLRQHPRATPRQVASLSTAIEALEAMLKSTDGIDCTFGIAYSAGDKEFRESKYIDFRISKMVFGISQTGSSYEISCGSDSYSDQGWMVEIGGKAYRECEPFQVEDSVAEFLNLGARIVVDDGVEYDDDEADTD